LPSLGKKIASAKMFSDRTPLKFTETDLGLSIKIPKGKREEIDTIVELELK